MLLSTFLKGTASSTVSTPHPVLYNTYYSSLLQLSIEKSIKELVAVCFYGMYSTYASLKNSLHEYITSPMDPLENMDGWDQWEITNIQILYSDEKFTSRNCSITETYSNTGG